MPTPLEELQNQIEQTEDAPHAPPVQLTPARRPATRLTTRPRLWVYVALAYLAGMVSCVTLVGLGQRMDRAGVPVPARTALPSTIPNAAQQPRCPIKIKEDGFFIFTNTSDRKITIRKITLNRQYSVSLPFNYPDGKLQSGALAIGEELWLTPFKFVDGAGRWFHSGMMTAVTWRIDTDAGDWRIDWK